MRSAGRTRMTRQKQGPVPKPILTLIADPDGGGGCQIGKFGQDPLSIIMI